MICKPESMSFTEKKIRILIAGFPGIGKTTLALSAPKPLYIDVDLSADRIDRQVFNLAKGVMAGEGKPLDYETIRHDLGMGCSAMELETVKANLADYQTIVVDTGGKLLNIMGNYGKKLNIKYAQTDGSLSLKGYGWLGKEFQRFLDHIIYELDKHFVIVFHTIEEKDGEATKLRIKAEGSSKNSVWEVMDLGGFVEMQGKNRTIGFSNCERYFAKGTRGIHGVMQIPELTPGQPNDFLTKLFAMYNSISEKETEQAAADKEAYDSAMEAGKAIIDAITDAASANEAVAGLAAIPHALTSKKELGTLLNKKIKSCNLFYDKVAKLYTPAPPKKEGK